MTTNIKLKVTPLFPSRVIEGTGIDIEKSGTEWTISLDYSQFEIRDPYVPDSTHHIAVWDGSQFFLIPASGLAAHIVTSPSSLTIFDDATVGTVVGTLSVTGGTGSYTFSLTSNPGGKYSITGNQLKVAAALTAGTDTITIRADNGAGGTVDLTTTVTVLHRSAYSPTFYVYGF
jgi:hypothetical protein